MKQSTNKYNKKTPTSEGCYFYASARRCFRNIFITLFIALGFINTGYAIENDTITINQLKELTKDRPESPFQTVNLHQAGLKVLVPFSPHWSWKTKSNDGVISITMTSPKYYYPDGTIEIIAFPNTNIPFEEFAIKELTKIRMQLGASQKTPLDSLMKVNLGAINGIVDQFSIDQAKDKNISIFCIAGFLPSNKRIIFLISVAKGHMKSAIPIANKIWKNIEEIPISNIRARQ